MAHDVAAVGEAAAKRSSEDSRTAARTAAALEGLQNRMQGLAAAEEDAAQLRKMNRELQQRLDEENRQRTMIESELTELVRLVATAFSGKFLRESFL